MSHMKHTHDSIRKITINLPASLLEDIVDDDKSLTGAIREAIELYKRKKLFAKLEARRGKIDFGATWQELKADRE